MLAYPFLQTKTQPSTWQWRPAKRTFWIGFYLAWLVVSLLQAMFIDNMYNHMAVMHLNYQFILAFLGGTITSHYMHEYYVINQNNKLIRLGNNRSPLGLRSKAKRKTTVCWLYIYQHIKTRYKTLWVVHLLLTTCMYCIYLCTCTWLHLH